MFRTYEVIEKPELLIGKSARQSALPFVNDLKQERYETFIKRCDETNQITMLYNEKEFAYKKDNIIWFSNINFNNTGVVNRLDAICMCLADNQKLKLGLDVFKYLERKGFIMLDTMEYANTKVKEVIPPVIIDDKNDTIVDTVFDAMFKNRSIDFKKAAIVWASGNYI